MKPTNQELERALQSAQRMRDQGDDPEFLAKTLLYLERRDELLEQILQRLELYLSFGQPEDEHARLVRLVEEARRQALIDRGEEPEEMGL